MHATPSAQTSMWTPESWVTTPVSFNSPQSSWYFILLHPKPLELPLMYLQSPAGFPANSLMYRLSPSGRTRLHPSLLGLLEYNPHCGPGDNEGLGRILRWLGSHICVCSNVPIYESRSHILQPVESIKKSGEVEILIHSACLSPS